MAPPAAGTGGGETPPAQQRPQALLRGSLTWAGSLEDGFLVRWTRPQDKLLVLRRPGLPAGRNLPAAA